MSTTNKSRQRNKGRKKVTKSVVVIPADDQPRRKTRQEAADGEAAPERKRAQILRDAVRETASELKGEQIEQLSHRWLGPPTLNQMRHHVVLAMISLIGTTAIAAMFSPSGMEVFTKLLPIFTFILGYLFPSR